MGKYSGILLCSDFDGTLFNGTKIPQNNMRAIKEFRRGGGLFTVISGRPINFLPPFFEGYSFGVPVGNLNGAVVYDIDNKKIIRESFMSHLTRERALSYAAGVENYKGFIFFQRGEILHIPKDRPDLVTDELCKSTYKLVIELWDDVSAEESNAAFTSVSKTLCDEHLVLRSSYRLIEIVDKSLTKASTALFLKEYTGVRTLICVGDFENDIDMIKAADIGYAVSNAADAVKQAADRITCSVDEGAIAKIISEL